MRSFKSFSFILLSLIIITASTCTSQSLDTPLEKCNYKKVTTHLEMMLYLDEVCQAGPSLSLQVIGESVQGRSIPMVHRNSLTNDKGVKVLLFCQQHGNEPSGKEAALVLLKEIAIARDNSPFSNIDLYLIPCLNPDGNESAKRFNANDSDLNRNHLILSEPEVITLHNVYNRIKPEVTLDVHEYSAFRRSFREAGYVRSVDEQFGAPTNLNISSRIIDYSMNTLFPFLEKYLNEKAITFSNYYKMDGPDDTVRASTTGIIDGRQSLAINNTFSFILEGKNGLNFNEGLKRRTSDQLEALKAFLTFVDLNASSIKSLVQNEQEKLFSLKDSVIVQMDYNFDGATIDLPMTVLSSNKDTIVTMPYSPKVIKLKLANRPAAYVVPKKHKELIDLINRHNISYHTVTNSYNQSVEIYKIKNITEKWLENKSFKIISLSPRTQDIKLEEGDVIIPVKQIANNMICILFEPESMWGLSQYDEFQDYFKKGSNYPIFRVLIQ